MLTLPGENGYEETRREESTEESQTWVGCGRNGLISVSPSRLSCEDEICLQSTNEAEQSSHP